MNRDEIEKILVEKVVKGDRNSFNEIVENYKKLVAHIVYTIIKNPNDRDDLCQDIFMKVYVNLGSFRFKSRLSTWIGRIAYNACLNFQIQNRDESRDKDIWSEDVDDIQAVDLQEKDPESACYQEQLSKIIQNKIEELPVRNQTVFTLFHFDGLSYREIADILDMSIDNIKVVLFRSRKILREKILKDYQKEDLCI